MIMESLLWRLAEESLKIETGFEVAQELRGESLWFARTRGGLSEESWQSFKVRWRLSA